MIKITLLAVLSLWIVAIAPAMEPAAPLFADDAILEAELLAPIAAAYGQKSSDEREWQQGLWKFSAPDGEQISMDVGIRTRGIFRRKNCRLPPLRLNFKKKQGKRTLFEGQDKLKLVAPCKNSKNAQHHIILEYLAYRTLNVLTENSLRVRLVRLNYVDSDGRKKPWTHLTFLVESEEGLAARRGMQVHHVPRLNSTQLDAEKTALVEVFQLLIANNDYSTIRGPEGRDCCHNIEIIGPENATDGLIPIPYDFDASGLVNTGYAAPPEKLPIKSVRSRYFRGRCKTPDVWVQTATHFQNRRKEVIGLFADSAELSAHLKKKTIRYLEKFYAILDNPKRLKNQITDRCYGS